MNKTNATPPASSPPPQSTTNKCYFKLKSNSYTDELNYQPNQNILNKLHNYKDDYYDLYTKYLRLKHADEILQYWLELYRNRMCTVDEVTDDNEVKSICKQTKEEFYEAMTQDKDLLILALSEIFTND